MTVIIPGRPPRPVIVDVEDVADVTVTGPGPRGPVGPQGPTGPAGVSSWGGITGTLSAQADLQAALNGKQAAGSYATAAQGALADTALQPGANIPWATVTGEPTTLAGYGITDAQPLSAVLTATTASFTVADEAKLDGVAAGATVNSPDATLLARGNHTGTQSASTIIDFSETVDDRVAALIVAGTNMAVTYDDVANTLTLDATGGGGTVHRGSTTISFGAAPGSSYATATVSHAGISAADGVKVWVQGTTADHNEIEHLILASRVGLYAVPASNSFTIHAETELRLSGSVALHWEAA